MSGVRLVWDGKTAEVPRLRLPLQVVEVVNSPRADRGSLFEQTSSEGSADGLRNRLIWGDNLHAPASLADELAGQVDLIYIDPPFDSRQDYKVRIAVGDGSDGADQDLSKLSSVIEEKAYRDTWGKGVESYLQMLYSRLVLLRELLSDRGSIFLHLVPNLSHLARVLMDEVFGADNFRAEIIWQRTAAKGDAARKFGAVHDVVSHYSKTEKAIFASVTRQSSAEYLSRFSLDDGDGRGPYTTVPIDSPSPRPNLTYGYKGFQPPTNGWRFGLATMQELDLDRRLAFPNRPEGRIRKKNYLHDQDGQSVGDVWTDLSPVNSQAHEAKGYDTQKPEPSTSRQAPEARRTTKSGLDQGARRSGRARVDEDPFRKHEARLRSAADLVELVSSLVRSRALAGLGGPFVESTREEALARQRAVAERLTGVSGVDELIRLGARGQRWLTATCWTPPS